MRRLFSQTMEPGARVIEQDLADELGVSRTPLREALLQLEFEGFLRSYPGRGFMVRRLEPREAIELFQLGGLLEPMALQQAGLPGNGALQRLETINEERAELVGDPERRDTIVELDDQWHRLLVSGCRNRVLLGMLRLIRNRLYRYVVAFTMHQEDLLKAIEEHRSVLAALAEGDLQAATLRLEDHWSSSERSMRRLLLADDPTHTP